MTTPSSTDSFLFQTDSGRDVSASFDGGHVTADGGALLLAEAERATGILRRLAGCFTDHRDPDKVEHTLPQLLKQRIFGLCLGYEDLNDHDTLRHDPLLAILVGKKDPTGQNRVRAQDKGKALAGKSTLNRLELTPVRANAQSRYKKVVAHLERMRNYSRILAQALSEDPRYRDQIDAEYVRLIYQTSPLHDIGKVGIPDCVLLKPGRLSDSERLAWFSDRLRTSSREHDHQVIIFTCRPGDYLRGNGGDDDVTAVNLAGLVS